MMTTTLIITFSLNLMHIPEDSCIGYICMLSSFDQYLFMRIFGIIVCSCKRLYELFAIVYIPILVVFWWILFILLIKIVLVIVW